MTAPCFRFLFCKKGQLMIIIFKWVNTFRMVPGSENARCALALTLLRKPVVSARVWKAVLGLNKCMALNRSEIQWEWWEEEAAPGVLRPFLPPVPVYTHYSNRGPNAWLVPVRGPFGCSPRLSPALSEPKSRDGRHPHRQAWVKWAEPGSHGWLAGH